MPAVGAEPATAAAEELISRYGADRSNLIHVLQDIQERFGYLPVPALRRLSLGMKLPLAEVLRVATFYAALSLEPKGEHLISVCMGTACHVRGALRIMDAVRRKLGLREGLQTTHDDKFTVKSVRCIGCCGLAPVITIDEDVHGRLTPAQVPAILKRYD